MRAWLKHDMHLGGSWPLPLPTKHAKLASKQTGGHASTSCMSLRLPATACQHRYWLGGATTGGICVHSTANEGRGECWILAAVVTG